MTIKERILQEIERVPESYLAELFDFIQFLESKALKSKIELAIASESSLAKDWLNPKEDKAWKDL